MSFITNAIGDVVGSLTGANQQAAAAQTAAGDQESAALAGINQQKDEFDQIQKLLAPYVSAGTTALTGYNGATSQYGNTLTQLNNLTGANGASAQQTALSGLTSNPLYTTAMNLGQQAILANASATGGLRGGNTISSLGYLPQQILANVQQQQIGNLGASLTGTQGLAGLFGQLYGIGENAAAGTGNAGIQTGNNITSLLGQQGAAQAGAALAQGNATASGLNSLGSLLGNTTALNNIGNMFSSIGSGIGSLWSTAAGASSLGAAGADAGVGDSLAAFA
ncbi:hypothetical protein [Paraburkholderia caballeronis]|uniref:hypothetical protein n=1 Tax=Paraburkholderia caballeronis TaxID=416943 RepID=UPI0010668085|nr:hypothetical protein [Paraburkholderia caballeronis]TDV06069.1 hypothetical protein C7408_12450 [Paraburkholderia caballeronis]TDV09609.1 hypothetical protein C7406_12650 [Paraburkholderia caballeronis]TDV21674.1 hypothetical protein C7404_12150 [Paraburkholderia caballeronis]